MVIITPIMTTTNTIIKINTNQPEIKITLNNISNSIYTKIRKMSSSQNLKLKKLKKISRQDK